MAAAGAGGGENILEAGGQDVTAAAHSRCSFRQRPGAGGCTLVTGTLPRAPSILDANATHEIRATVRTTLCFLVLTPNAS